MSPVERDSLRQPDKGKAAAMANSFDVTLPTLWEYFYIFLLAGALRPVVCTFLDRVSFLPVSEDLEAVFHRQERTNQACFRCLQFGVYEPCLPGYRNHRLPEHVRLVHSNLFKSAFEFSLTSAKKRGSRERLGESDRSYRKTEGPAAGM